MPNRMRTSDFDYELPEELIAQAPARSRDASRLLVLERSTGVVRHCPSFRDFPGFIKPGDALVLNDSRVIPARLRGERILHGRESEARHGMSGAQTPAQFEILLLEEVRTNEWWAMMRPGKRARTGTRIRLHGEPTLQQVTATVMTVNEEGHRLLRFEGTADITSELDRLGEVPLPPYIHRPGRCDAPEDRERYQTVFADVPGSVAAPTAGLHFTPELLDTLAGRGIRILRVTLHVGLGTFAPVKHENLASHPMHEERFEISCETARALEETRAANGRVFAVGTTSLRVLESVAAQNRGRVVAGRGRTRLFVYPPYRFEVVNALLTNFHLPRSTLLMLVSAFAAPGSTDGVSLVRRAYAEAIRERYRFFSYGDAMLLL